MARLPSNKTSAKNIRSKKAPIVDKAELSPNTPIPFEGGRAFSISHSEEYLPFLSSEDNFAQLLIESRLLSDTNNACINTKRDFCAGSGFQHIENKPLDGNFLDWIESINLNDEDSVDISSQILDSHFTYGNTPIEIVKVQVGTEKKLYVYVHDFLEWRLGKPDDNGVITEAIQSKLFLKYKRSLTTDEYKKANKLPLYNPKRTREQNWKKVGNSERTLLWYKNKMTGFKHYGMPSNIASLIYQILEYKGARFNVDNFDNNLVISALVALKGSISQNEADRIGRKIIKSHTGEGRTGRVTVIASEEGIDGSEVKTLDTHKEGSFIEADEMWTQKIILANGWDAVLMGLLSSSTFGKGSGFVSKIFELKQKTVIKPAQQDLLKKVWYRIFDIANEWLGLKIDKRKIEIRNSIDISALTDVDITPAVKVNEVREAKGLVKDTSKKGDMYLGELGANQKKGVYVKDTSGSGETEE